MGCFYAWAWAWAHSGALLYKVLYLDEDFSEWRRVSVEPLCDAQDDCGPFDRTNAEMWWRVIHTRTAQVE